ncbi:SEL1-like repeat protein [Caproiciproducens sp. R1]|uniref:SEL1-like repeat protein n=1 Tax=Caproiciproducens sp. R1 TaxID=3435000 RepID=UPI004034D66A
MIPVSEPSRIKVAAEWYTKASMEDVSYADYRLAQMYSNGQGVERDDELAGVLYQKALTEFIEQDKQQPDADTEFRVANMYLKGLGMEANPEEGLKWLEICCEKKNARAQYQLAGMYQKGDGVPQDEIKAQSLYNEALAGFLEQEKETPAAYVEYQIASMYKHGNGTEQDNYAAFQWYVEAAEKGHPHAAYCTARAYYEGAGTEQSYPDAVKWYQKAAKSGDAYAMYELGKMYRDGIGVESNKEKAYQHFLAAAKLGHEFAQFAAAKALLSGAGVEKNIQGAVDWFRECAEKENPFAAYQLGVLFSAGEEISKDDSLAQKFYSMAIAGFISLDRKKPDAGIERKIAQMFYSGNGTAQNYAAAAQWFSMSAAKDDPYSQFQFARMIQKGEGTPVDELKSQLIYAAAISGFLKILQENPDADLLYKVGMMYEAGLGIKRDLSTAKQYYTEAAAEGNVHAQLRLNQIQAYQNQAAVSTVMGLFNAFVYSLGDNIKDSTTRKYRHDRKLTQKQKAYDEQEELM